MIYGRASNLFAALDFERNPPSIANLPAALTINGQTVYPTLRYKGGDAGSALWKPWGYGETLTLQAGTAPSYNQGSPLLGAVDDSVRFNTGGYYLAPGTTGNLTTEDFVLEFVISLGGAAGRIIGTYTDANPLGWLLYEGTANRVDLYVVGAGGNAHPFVATSGIVHGFLTYDKSGSCILYLNGVAAWAAEAVSSVGSLTSINKLEIGRVGTSPFGGKVFYLSMWQGASWLDTHVQPTIAATRFAQLTGVYPQSARGTYLPTAVTRSSAGYLDKVESDGTTKLYYVGSNWPRICSRKDSAGTKRTGYLSETSAQNTLTYSNGFASWGKARTTLSNTPVVLPDGTTSTANIIKDDTSEGAHYFARASGNTGTTAAVYSVFAKAIGGTFINLTTDGGKAGYFNVATGTVGTIGAGCTGTMTPFGNGWYRCQLKIAVSVAGADCYIFESNDGITTTYLGDGTDRIAIWQAQFETGNEASSIVPTTTTAVTRSADLLRYKMDDGNLNSTRGALECNVLLPNIDNALAPGLWILSDGTTSNRVLLTPQGTGSENSALYITVGGVTQAAVIGTTDIWNNAWNKLRGIWGPNDARLLVNSVQEGTQDVSVTVPTGLTQLDVGAYLSAGYELNGLLSNLKIFSSGKIRQR